MKDEKLMLSARSSRPDLNTKQDQAADWENFPRVERLSSRPVGSSGKLRLWWRKFLLFASIPIVLAEFFDAETGQEYGVGFLTKIKLALRIFRNRKRIPTASHFLEHLIMATAIFKVPKAVKGCVVECGTFKGGSAASLSLICELCDRKLEIFDSFAGLPAPQASDAEHRLLGTQTIHTYEEGAYRGTLPEVQENIAKCGCLTACHFNSGFFEESLPMFQSACVLVYVDVDLTSSLQTCVKYLWPLLEENCCFFTHEAQQMEVSSLFFDNPWWRSNLRSSAPGLIGAGTGLGLIPEPGGYRSDLGFTIKDPRVQSFAVSAQIGNPDRIEP